jgi:hypothetical protein
MPLPTSRPWPLRHRSVLESVRDLVTLNCRRRDRRRATSRRPSLEALEARELLAGTPAFAVGASAGAAPEVRVPDETGAVLRTFLAYDPTVRGGVRTAVADLTAALAEANTLARPPGPAGPSPAEAWDRRTPIGAGERAAFTATVAAQRTQANERGETCGPEAQTVRSEAEVTRTAIRRALEECGYLHYTRRRIPPPIPRRKVARIT